jgi:peptidoglycan/xylan/chitin deacetylase (PgdA/CDA1 family)
MRIGGKALTFFAVLFFLPFYLVPAETPLAPVAAHYRVALTFDDGPRPGSTPLLQEMLARHNVKATFFVVGRMVFLHPELARALFDAGHELAGHSWSHGDVKKMSANTLKMELDLTRMYLKRITGKETWYFRPPGGTERYFKTRFVCPAHYDLVLWNVHSLDQEGRSVEEIIARVESQVKDGDVVLMHNGLPTTIQALDTIIPHLKARGFEFVTISELYGSRENVARAVAPAVTR